MLDIIYRIKFQCFYPNGNKCDHWQDLTITQIPRWVDSYKFTHPDCIAISVHVNFEKMPRE